MESQRGPSRAVADQNVSDAELAGCLKVLRVLGRQPYRCVVSGSADAVILQQAAQLVREVKALEKNEGRERDRELLQAAGAERKRRAASPPEPPAGGQRPELSTLRTCYVCGRPYNRPHWFYETLCPACAAFNYAKRTQTAELAGRVALVTGARVKIGYQVALKLLRARATVIATTRFPVDAADRYAAEPDFAEWHDRLTIFGLDLRHLAGVERFAHAVGQRFQRLDVLVNNAAQTLRRPPAFYEHLIDAEVRGLAARPPGVRALIGTVPGPGSEARALRAAGGLGHGTPPAAALSQLALLPEDDAHAPHLFPPGAYDGDGQQVDRRPRNSWVLKLGELSTVELVEVHAVNCLAPFLLLRGLEAMLLQGPPRDRYVVNVSAAEGRFGAAKNGNHPHTNMAKAALNMITHTCAADYARRRVFMNSVDTGWASNQFPGPAAERMEQAGFRPPVDFVDAAARVCDPVFTGLNTGQSDFGKLLKDYHEAPW
jgi:NAD(P)-dependent dehydrogenase (short-subunit alcohol dehydrogenase family)